MNKRAISYTNDFPIAKQCKNSLTPTGSNNLENGDDIKAIQLREPEAFN